MSVIFFDLDQTLFNYGNCLPKTLSLIYSEWKVQISASKENFIQQWNLAVEKYYRNPGVDFTFEEQGVLRIKEVFSHFGLVLDHKTCHEKFSRYLEIFESKWPQSIFDDVVPVLEGLKEKRLGIITNGYEDLQHRKISSIGIEKYFLVIVTSERARYAKPNPEIFFHACKLLKANPKECIYIGDSIEADVVGSRNAGLKPIWLDRDGRHNQNIVDRYGRFDVVEDLSGVLKLIAD